MKKILVACAGGVATSTVVRSKLKKALDDAGLAGSYVLEQCKVSDAPTKARSADLLIETTQIVGTFECPAYSGVPFLTGVGVDKLMPQILSDLTA
nr:PTS sugar transporter subunit IIB [Olegusella massiliensis]